MFDHVTIRVTSRAASVEFYETVLGALDIETTYADEAFVECAKALASRLIQDGTTDDERLDDGPVEASRHQGEAPRWRREIALVDGRHVQPLLLSRSINA